MEEVFELVTGNQKQSQNQIEEQAEKRMQVLRDSIQTTTQSIQDHQIEQYISPVRR